MEKIELAEGKRIISQLRLRKGEITGGVLEDSWGDMVDAIEWIINALITMWNGVIWIIDHIWLLIILCGAILLGTILLLTSGGA